MESSAEQNWHKSASVERRKGYACIGELPHLICGPLATKKKRKESWSSSRTPTGKNIPSMSAEVVYLCWRNLRSSKIRLWRRSGSTNRDLFKVSPWHLGAPMRTRRTLPGLLVLNIGSWFRIVCLNDNDISFLYIYSNCFGVYWFRRGFLQVSLIEEWDSRLPGSRAIVTSGTWEIFSDETDLV